MRAYEILTEGGNAFTDVGAIHISEIAPTLQWLAKQINHPEILKQTLGSVGKREYSGDIDVVVDLDREEMKQLALSLHKVLGQENVRGMAGNVITRVPIQNYDASKDKRGPRTGYVQVDFFPGDPEWMSLYYAGTGEESKLKGVHRNLYISTLSKYVDRKASDEEDSFGRPVESVRWRWSPRDGLIKVLAKSKKNDKGGWARKQDIEYLSQPIKNADMIADILFKGEADADALGSVESLIAATKKAFDKETQKEIFKAFAKTAVEQGHREGFEYPPEIEKYFA